jgi:cytoskeletal protein CcmA (bactofilin family)
MAQTYTRQSSIADGDTITAALFNNEYNQLLNAFSYSSSSASSTGHRHDGTAGQGGNIHTIGDLDFLNKIVADSTNNRWGVFVEVSGSAVEQIRIQDGAIVPVTDNDIDLGTSSLEFKDGYFDGTVYADAINFNGTAISATAAELNIMDGVTATTAELNIMDGVTSTAAELNILDGVTASATDLNLIDGITNGTVIASKAIITDSNKDITGGRNITISGELDAATLDISGDADIDGTLEADAITIGGVTLAETISDTVGAMVSSNTETNITVTYEDSDNTLDFVIGTLNQDTTGTAALATSVTVSANNSTDETIFPVFVDGATGTQGLETDTGLTYNPSSGKLTATEFVGNIDAVDGDFDGTLETDALSIGGTTVTSTAAELNILDGVTSTAAELNILDGVTSTAAELNILDGVTSTAAELNILDGVTASATDLNLIDGITNGTVIASKAIITDSNKDISGGRNITISGELDAATLDISGDADIDGTLEADAITVNGTALASVIAGTTVANATLAATTTVTDSTANTNFPVIFHDESNALLDDTGALRYNPSTGTLLVPNLNVAGTTTQVDTVTMEASNAIIFEGATSDAHETTLTVVDPTGDRTIGLPNVSGTLPVLAAASTTQISSTPEELNILDGATVVVGEINALDLGSTAVGTAIASKAVILDSNKDYTGVRNFTLSGELDAGSLDVSGDADIDGTLETDALSINGTAITSTAAELNLIDGGATVGTTAVADGDGILHNDAGTMKVTSAATFKTYFQAGLSSAADDISAGDAAVNITTSSGDITIDAAANDSDIIFKGTDNSSDITMLTLDGSDAGSASFNDKVTIGDGKLVLNATAVTSTGAELNILDGVTSTTAELNILDGVTSTAAELNILDGVTSTAAELNILDGVTSTAAELNILDGVTSTAAELNILDGVTSTAAELNIIDGNTSATSTTLADADRVVVNDNGTMVQVALTDLDARDFDIVTSAPTDGTGKKTGFVWYVV